MAAVKQTVSALKYASPELRNDNEIMMVSMMMKMNKGSNCFKIYHTSKDNQDDGIASGGSDGDIGRGDGSRSDDVYGNSGDGGSGDNRCDLQLKYEYHETVPFENMNYFQVLSCVKQFGFNLKEVSYEYQNNYDIVLAAVKNCGSSLRYASDRLQDNEHIVLGILPYSVIVMLFKNLS